MTDDWKIAYTSTLGRNQTALNLAEQTMDWVISSGLANAQTGDILDGKNVGSCNVVTGSQWTYNYGEMLGALSWMHLAVSSYLLHPT